MSDEIIKMEIKKEQWEIHDLSSFMSDIDKRIKALVQAVEANSDSIACVDGAYDRVAEDHDKRIRKLEGFIGDELKNECNHFNEKNIFKNVFDIQMERYVMLIEFVKDIENYNCEDRLGLPSKEHGGVNIFIAARELLLELSEEDE